jgi:hypothetical protein
MRKGKAKKNIFLNREMKGMEAKEKEWREEGKGRERKRTKREGGGGVGGKGGGGGRGEKWPKHCMHIWIIKQ